MSDASSEPITWWNDIPDYIRRRITETARTVDCKHTTNDPDWWLPIVAHLLEANAVALPLDVDRERRAARELAEVKLRAVEAELNRVRIAASQSAAAHWERRARAAARIVVQTSRKTVPVAELWDALELIDSFGRVRFEETDLPAPGAKDVLDDSHDPSHRSAARAGRTW